MSYVDLTDIIRDQVPMPERHSGYVVDLTSIQFEEGETPTSWVHALSLGNFKHPLWGKMKFTPERIQRFATNVNSNVRGIDIAIDYSHKSGDEAAGWVRKAEPRSNGLWLFVEWTKQAAQRIQDREFRYFSSEFVDEWVSDSGQKFKDVILGGGLTNRPFLKNLLPVNLSELYHEGKEKEDESMELTELLKTLGLSEDADEAKAIEAIKQLQEEANSSDDDDDGDDTPDKDVIELAEDNPVVKALVDKVAELEASQRLDEATRLVDNWSSGSQKKFALPPATTEKLSEILVSAPASVTEGLAEVMDHILDNGLVSLEEKGTSKPRGGGSKEETASSKFLAKVKELQDENEGMTFADAYSEASRDEELYREYRRETIAGAVTEEVNE